MKTKTVLRRPLDNGSIWFDSSLKSVFVEQLGRVKVRVADQCTSAWLINSHYVRKNDMYVPRLTVMSTTYGSMWEELKGLCISIISNWITLLVKERTKGDHKIEFLWSAVPISTQSKNKKGCCRRVQHFCPITWWSSDSEDVYGDLQLWFFRTFRSIEEQHSTSQVVH